MEKVISCKEYNELFNNNSMEENERLSLRAVQCLLNSPRELTDDEIRDNYPAYRSTIKNPGKIYVKFPTYRFEILGEAEERISEYNLDEILKDYMESIEIVYGESHLNYELYDDKKVRSYIADSCLIICKADSLNRNKELAGKLQGILDMNRIVSQCGNFILHRCLAE